MVGGVRARAACVCDCRGGVLVQRDLADPSHVFNDKYYCQRCSECNGGFEFQWRSFRLVLPPRADGRRRDHAYMLGYKCAACGEQQVCRECHSIGTHNWRFHSFVADGSGSVGNGGGGGGDGDDDAAEPPAGRYTWRFCCECGKIVDGYLKRRPHLQLPGLRYGHVDEAFTTRRRRLGCHVHTSTAAAAAAVAGNAAAETTTPSPL